MDTARNFRNNINKRTKNNNNNNKNQTLNPSKWKPKCKKELVFLIYQKEEKAMIKKRKL